jgi:putative membrane protein
MKKIQTGLMSAAALLLSVAALAAPQGTSGSMGASASSRAQLSSADRKFIDDAASAGMFEVQAAQLAQSKAQDSSTKSYAKQMVTDHEKNNRQLMQIAESKGVTPPTKLDAKHQAMLSKLQKADGSEFDQQYGRIMDQSHKEAVQLFERGEKQVKDSELKSYISQTLPTLHQHHEQAASLPGAKGGTSRSAEAGGSSSSPGYARGTGGSIGTGGSSSSGTSGTTSGSSNTDTGTRPPGG